MAHCHVAAARRQQSTRELGQFLKSYRLFHAKLGPGPAAVLDAVVDHVVARTEGRLSRYPCARNIASALSMPRRSVLRHLRYLTGIGLVICREQAVGSRPARFSVRSDLPQQVDRLSVAGSGHLRANLAHKARQFGAHTIIDTRVEPPAATASGDPTTKTFKIADYLRRRNLIPQQFTDPEDCA